MPMDDNTSLPSEDSLGDKDGNDLQVQDLVESEVKVERIVEEAVLKAAIRIKRESFSLTETRTFKSVQRGLSRSRSRYIE